MRLQRYNEAEAMLEPYYDGGDSDHTKYNRGKLPYYTLSPEVSPFATIRQNWDGLLLTFQKGETPASLSMSRNCRIPVGEYDILRIFGSIPASVEVSVRAELDGNWKDLGKKRGADPTGEFDFPFQGKDLTGIEMTFGQVEAKEAGINLHWLGLSNKDREEAMVRRPKGFDGEWRDLLREKEDPGAFEPQIGIWFGRDELAALRVRVKSGPLAAFYGEMRRQAEKDLEREPEKDIGVYIPHPDRRWVRTRDMNREDTSLIMQRLAFVGLIEEDPRMSRMAARMALSAAHCEYWCESIMGVLPGTLWHHRSFTEQSYLKGCALVLDWAGDFLTPYGRSVIVDAMVMKGLPRLESDFKRQEYIRYMNQGVFFSSGRIFGLLALTHFFPRYRDTLPDAEKDLNEIIAAYIQKDGGTPEGPGYWSGTFHYGLPLYFVLARYHGKDMGSYASEALKKTGDYALSMLSVTGNGILTYPLNDAHASLYPPELMAAFWRLTGGEGFRQVLAVELAQAAGEIKAGKTLSIQPAPELFMLAPDELPGLRRYGEAGYYLLPDLGMARLVREDPELGRVGFLLISGLADRGHYHHDKGSFILETGDEHLLIDRGIVTYSHPDVHLMGKPQYHNLFLPVFEDGIVMQKALRQGAFLDQSEYRGDLFSAVADSTGAWDDKRVLENRRKVTSPSAREYLLEDSLKTSEASTGIFILNTYLPCVREGKAVILKGERTLVRVEPEDWTPERIIIEEFGVDGELRPVTRVSLISGKAAVHQVSTRVRLEPGTCRI
jgi:hypothetical protein